VTGGGWRKLGRKASNRYNYAEVAKAVAKVCGGISPPVLTGCGPASIWSKVLVQMNRADKRSSRKTLQTIWKENRGNVQVTFLNNYHDSSVESH